MYNIKYRLEYRSRSEHNTKIEILKRNYTENIITLIGSSNPVELNYDLNDDFQFASFKSSYLTIEIKLTPELKQDFRELSDEDDFILNYYRNNELIWTGYILAEQYQEGDDNNQPFFRQRFYDGISRLRIATIETLIERNLIQLATPPCPPLTLYFEGVNATKTETCQSTNKYALPVVGQVCDFCSGETLTLVIDTLPGVNIFDFFYLSNGTSVRLFRRFQEPVSVNGQLVSIASSQGLCELICNGTPIVIPPSITSNLASLGIYSLKDFFIAINKFLYLSIKGNTVCRFNDFLVNTVDLNKNLLEVIHIRKSSLYDKDDIPLNLYDMMVRIASAFNLTYLTWKGDLHITNFEYSKNPKFISLPTNDITQYNYHKNIGHPTHFFIDKSKYITYWDSLKKMEVFHIINGVLSYFDFDNFDNIVMLREYDGMIQNAPVIDKTNLIFKTFADIIITRTAPMPERSYKDVYVESLSRGIIITNNSSDGVNRRYRLKFFIRMEFDYGVSQTEYDNMTVEQRQKLQDDIIELEKNTQVRIYYRITNIVNGITYYLGGSRSGSIRTFNTFQTDVEVNENRGFDSFEPLIEGFDFSSDIEVKQGINNLFIRIYHPYVATNLFAVSSTNLRRVQGVTTYINVLEFLSIDKLNLEEIRHEGVTDRNVFNYNLERDREYYYINLEQTAYKYNFLNNNFGVISLESFKRRTKDYLSLLDENLDVNSLLLKQSLEQLGIQQEHISGDLMVRNDTNFGPFSTIQIENATLSVMKYNYSDKQGVYEIELIDVK